jgi:hypothetical protein
MYKQMFKSQYFQFKVLEQERLNSAAGVGDIINSEVNKETKIAFNIKTCTKAGK